jgi:multimeric flavodoxin WrbA
MKVLVYSSSPNLDGLTAACAHAALEGIRDTGNTAESIRINDLKVGSCEACDDGWGTCRESHLCEVLDDFQALHERTLKADAYVFVTPV